MERGFFTIPRTVLHMMGSGTTTSFTDMEFYTMRSLSNYKKSLIFEI